MATLNCFKLRLIMKQKNEKVVFYGLFEAKESTKGSWTISMLFGPSDIENLMVFYISVGFFCVEHIIYLLFKIILMGTSNTLDIINHS